MLQLVRQALMRKWLFLFLLFSLLLLLFFQTGFVEVDVSMAAALHQPQNVCLAMNPNKKHNETLSNAMGTSITHSDMEILITWCPDR
jgi:hypothetical protein